MYSVFVELRGQTLLFAECGQVSWKDALFYLRRELLGTFDFAYVHVFIDKRLVYYAKYCLTPTAVGYRLSPYIFLRKKGFFLKSLGGK